MIPRPGNTGPTCGLTLRADRRGGPMFVALAGMIWFLMRLSAAQANATGRCRAGDVPLALIGGDRDRRQSHRIITARRSESHLLRQGLEGPAVRGAEAGMHVFGLKQNSPTTQLLKEKLALRRALNVSASNRQRKGDSGSGARSGSHRILWTLRPTAAQGEVGEIGAGVRRGRGWE